jgi:hypothetical protein
MNGRSGDLLQVFAGGAGGDTAELLVGHGLGDPPRLDRGPRRVGRTYGLVQDHLLDARPGKGFERGAFVPVLGPVLGKTAERQQKDDTQEESWL